MVRESLEYDYYKIYHKDTGAFGGVIKLPPYANLGEVCCDFNDETTRVRSISKEEYLKLKNKKPEFDPTDMSEIQAREEEKHKKELDKIHANINEFIKLLKKRGHLVSLQSDDWFGMDTIDLRGSIDNINTIFGFGDVYTGEDLFYLSMFNDHNNPIERFNNMNEFLDYVESKLSSVKNTNESKRFSSNFIRRKTNKILEGADIRSTLFKDIKDDIQDLKSITESNVNLSDLKYGMIKSIRSLLKDTRAKKGASVSLCGYTNKDGEFIEDIYGQDVPMDNINTAEFKMEVRPDVNGLDTNEKTFNVNGDVFTVKLADTKEVEATKYIPAHTVYYFDVTVDSYSPEIRLGNVVADMNYSLRKLLSSKLKNIEGYETELWGSWLSAPKFKINDRWLDSKLKSNQQLDKYNLSQVSEAKVTFRQNFNLPEDKLEELAGDIVAQCKDELSKVTEFSSELGYTSNLQLVDIRYELHPRFIQVYADFKITFDIA